MQGVASTDTHMRGVIDNDAVAQDMSDFIYNHPGKSSGIGASRQEIVANFKHRLGGEHKVKYVPCLTLLKLSTLQYKKMKTVYLIRRA
jgi:hypothetical protein